MSRYTLVGASDAAKDFALVLLGNGAARIEVLEDKCFRDSAYWSLGNITVQGTLGDYQEVYAAVSRGSYEWEVSELEEASRDLKKLLGIESPVREAKPSTKEQHKKTLDRIERILDAVATTAVRVGLIHPIFDSNSVECMPFRRGTTVIADTSGVLQGGLDFISRFLHPVARIKVPAIVHMEVVNQADSFLKRRRAIKINASALLFDHLLSQAGERVLLRLELRSDTEVERTLLVGDPLRNAFQRDSEQEWADLNLSVPLRSYCDRLIVEAARQHQAHANPGHPIQLLTSDQGFARMALAEGIMPLYFRAIASAGFFGRRLAGTAFHPLTGQLYRVSLQSIIWELATVFGAARLVSPDGNRWVEIAAFGEALAWSPIHSRNDLLWMRSNGLPESPQAMESLDPQAEAATPASLGKKNAAKTPMAASLRKTAPKQKPTRAGDTGFYRFSLERMLQLISRLGRDGGLNNEKAMQITGVESRTVFSEYKRFLLAGGFAISAEGALSPTEAGISLARAIGSADVDSLATELSRIPSVRLFLERLGRSAVGTAIELKVPERAETTYRALGEIVCAGAPIAEEGYYATPARPRLAEFVDMALDRFNELDKGDGFISVGSWLEALVRTNGIHPERSRRYLDEASAAALIIRSTEGSTTDIRHDQHAIRVLRTGPSGPRVEVIHLYRGDFLIPNKSSSSIRLARPKP